MPLACTNISSSTGLVVFLTGTMLMAGCEWATVRPLDPETGKAIVEEQTERFDPEAYALDVWIDRLPDVLETSAENASVLLRELARDDSSDRESAQSDPSGQPPSFLVQGQGVVMQVDTTSRVGTADVDLSPPDGTADLRLQIGPVIRGTALRDALPFVTFDAFDNQLEFAAVSRALHQLVADSALATLNRSNLEGASVAFSGAFTYRRGDPVVVTLIALRKED